MTNPAANPDSLSQEEQEKLIIFGWIVTVLGIPKKANPDKYNELTDRLYKLFQSLLSQEILKELEGLKGWSFGTDFGGYPYKGTTRTPEDILARIEDRISFWKRQK